MLDRLVPVGARLLRLPLILLGASWRVRIVGGGDTLRQLAGAGEPVIYGFWHQSLYPCGHYLYRLMRRHRLRLALLASLSRDGELVARMAAASGIEAVRGSTSRAGLSGLLALRRALVRRGASVLAAPDGPRGPARRCQQGIVVLAATSGAAIVPLAAAADRAWRLRSWDRLEIPKPFARVALTIGEPIAIDKRADLSEGAELVGRALDRLTRSCEEAVRSRASPVA